MHAAQRVDRETRTRRIESGTVGTVLEVLDGGDALLVEFGSDWLGVLHPTEVERVAYA
jgi:hypothetical protein